MKTTNTKSTQSFAGHSQQKHQYKQLALRRLCSSSVKSTDRYFQIGLSFVLYVVYYITAVYVFIKETEIIKIVGSGYGGFFHSFFW